MDLDKRTAQLVYALITSGLHLTKEVQGLFLTKSDTDKLNVYIKELFDKAEFNRVEDNVVTEEN